MRTVLVVGVALSFLLGRPARADEVVLTNGDRLTGRILELDAETLRLASELLGEIAVPRSAIASLSADHEVAVTLPDGRVVEATLSSQDGQLGLRTSTEQATLALTEVKAVRTPEGQAKYEQSLHPRWNQNWQLGLDLALSARGGGGTTRTTIGVEGARYTSNDELTFSYHSLLEREQRRTVVNDDKIRAAINYLHRISGPVFYFGVADFDYDALQHLNLRSVLGGGLGRRLKGTDKLVFDLLGGSAFNQEYFNDEPARRNPEGLVGEHVRWQMGPRAYLEERLFLFPSFSNAGEYRVRFASTIGLKINSWLSWQLNYGTHFLSDPPPDTKRNDSLITSGLRLTFGGGAKNHMWLER